MQALQTSDYRGQPWPSKEDEDEGYPLCVPFHSSPSFLPFTFPSLFYDSLTPFLSLSSPLVMKVRSRASSVMSGASTPGGGAYRSLSERDLEKADAALSWVNNDALQDGREPVMVNGKH